MQAVSSRNMYSLHGFDALIRPSVGAGVPLVDRRIELDARIGAGPCRVSDLVPQLAGAKRLARLWLASLAPRLFFLGAPVEVPELVVADGFHERIAHPHRVVAVLARYREVRFGVPIRVVLLELQAGHALASELNHALHVARRDKGRIGLGDRLA